MREIMTNAQIARNRDHWLEERRYLITASDIAGIMSLDPDDEYSSPTYVYWEKITGEARPDRMALWVGRMWEAHVADLYAGAIPEVHRGYMPADAYLEGGGLYAREDPSWAGATFDRLEVLLGPRGDLQAHPLEERGVNGRTPVEIKTSVSRAGWGDPPHGDMPRRVLAQAIWQGMVAGSHVVKVAVFFLPHGPLRVYLVDMHDPDVMEDAAVMLKRANTFLEDHLLPSVPPPLDYSPATELALSRAYRPVTLDEVVVVPAALWDKAWRADRALKAAERRVRAAKIELRARMGSAKRAITRSGQPVATRSVYSSRHVSLEQLRADWPDVAAACTHEAEQPTDKITIRQPKEDDES